MVDRFKKVNFVERFCKKWQNNVLLRAPPDFQSFCRLWHYSIFLSFSWWLREHIPINEAFDNQTFTQIIFAAEDDTATHTTYAIAPWTKGPFIGLNPPQKVVRYRIFDFYQLKNGKIS